VREALVPHADQVIGAVRHAGVDPVLYEREAELRVEELVGRLRIVWLGST